MEESASDEASQDRVRHHPKSKKKYHSNNSVRSYWFRFLKPALEAHPRIRKSDVFKRLAKIKDVSIKKLKNLIYEAMEHQEDFELTQLLYQELLSLFKKNSEIERQYPSYSSKLKTWFEQFVGIRYEDFLKKSSSADDEDTVVVVKNEELSNHAVKEEEQNLIYNTDNKIETVTIPVQYLLGLQNQFSFLIQASLKNTPPIQASRVTDVVVKSEYI
jgi:hypothetical protein